MKILAVDDEYMQLKMLERAIRENAAEAEIECFENPVEALAWAEKNKPEIVFCDIQMPLMTGIELGKALKRDNPKVNIIFVTSYYENYAVQAMSLHFSGYLQKPVTAEAVAMEMENLRYPLPVPKADELLRVQCFGNFEVYAQERPLHFERYKTKELLAYLIDRRGAQVTGNEICAALYENEDNEKNNKSGLRKCVADLKNTLKNVGAEDVFIKGFNAYAIVPGLIRCDYYDWEKGEIGAIRAFHGEYMSQYSWAEATLGQIMSDL